MSKIIWILFYVSCLVIGIVCKELHSSGAVSFMTGLTIGLVYCLVGSIVLNIIFNKED